MVFFSEEEFNLLNKYASKPKTSDLQNVYDQLKGAYYKIEYWATQLKKELFPSGNIKLRKSPINQGNHFEGYLWAKIYPSQTDFLENKIAYTVRITKDFEFVINIDTINLADKDLTRQKYYQLRDHLPIVSKFKSSDFLDWESLIQTSKKVVESLIPLYDKLKSNLFNKTDSSIDMPVTSRSITNNNIALNTILFGPPGTSKTFNTINKAISIVNPTFNLNLDRFMLKAEFDRLVSEGQIVFTTFHQSMTYEDFVEGIKPKIQEDSDGNKTVIYEIEDGIFKTICKNAIFNNSSSKNAVETEYTFNDAFTELISEANKHLENEDPLFLPIQTEKLGLKIVNISDKGNPILKPIYSENSKEYTVSYDRAQKLQSFFPDLSVIKNIDKEFRAVIGGANSTAYWAVLNYINKKIAQNKTLNIGIGSNENRPHVLIIDEINRGNISSIFGELITLIEDSKREGREEAISITLPYSKVSFSVPENVFIIGTMNTADRSVEALDTALRRRFTFEEMMPNYDLPELNYDLFGFKAFDVLQKINERISLLLDREHQLGHTYFIKMNESNIINSFYKNIIPLLQEYFFNDYGKIGLVLGDGFVRKVNHYQNSEKLFARFVSDTDASQYDDVERFEIIPQHEFKDGINKAQIAFNALMNS